MSIVSYARQARKLFYKEDDTPAYLLFFVTTICGLKCDHCFYWQETNVQRNELTIDEIEKISKSMGPFLQLTLTGGDACYRDDLTEIAECFYRNNDVRNITIGTNGLSPKRVMKLITPMVERCPRCDITVDLSMDGLGPVHDEIRGVKGSFERVNETYRKLQELQKTHSNLNTCIDVTASQKNHDKLVPVYEYIRDELDPDIINVLYIRGKPRNPGAKDIKVENYEEVNRMLEEDIKRGVVRSYKFMPDVLNVKDILLRRQIIKTVKENRYQIPCTAGALTGVLQTEGDVYPCEMLNTKIGNVRENGYDFAAIWTSPKAKEIRKQILETKCFCIHQCFLSNNILFNPSVMPKFLWTYLGLKMSKLKYALSSNGGGRGNGRDGRK
jgi:radical SAM protein with 4Fe4S-binding SPASM domain